MISRRHTVVLAAAFALTMVSTTAVAQQQSYRVNDQQVQDALNLIDARTGTFRLSFDRAIDRSRLKGSRAADEIDRSVNDFKQATARLRDRVNDRRSDGAAVDDVLRPATIIDTFMTGNQLDASVQRDWQDLRRELDGLARMYGVTWNRTPSQTTPSVANDPLVKQLLTRTTRDALQLRRSLGPSVARGRGRAAREEDDINRFVTELTEATARLNDQFDRRQSVTAGIGDLLQGGVRIDKFMQRHPLTTGAQNDWRVVRRDLDDLARASNVVWDWSNPPYATAESGAGGVNGRLGGTYQLDSSRGDDPRRAAEQVTRTVPAARRDRAYQRLMNRLEPPDVIALERQGNRVTMATSRGPRVTFDADNRLRTEAASDGRRLNTRATFTGDQLLLTTTGGTGNDFTVTFEPTDAGTNLRVIRRIVEDGRRQPVTVTSFYRKSSDQPQWDVYSRTSETGSSGNNSASDLMMPIGTRLVATLDADLSTKTTRDGDRFSMTVSSPSQYSGAVIEGVVSSVNASGRVSGRAELALNFQTIGQRNGRSSQFGGVIESMRTPGGETVRVDNEGKVEPTDSQTDKTVQRGTIGAALGAIIGAIAGGGKGAAVGAAIGAGGGAGTVIAAGRDQLDLKRGTEVTITSGAAVQSTSSGGAR
jgi:hypothetical protein